jgi:hypothetical protein
MKIDRLVSIIMILLDKERVGARELADMFEVSPRTIYRDIDALNMAGIPVRGAPGVGGGFEIMQNYKIDRKVFSAADLSALLMGLSSLSGMIRGDELVHALAKVKSFIPADRAKDIELKANQISIDVSPWMGSRNVQPYLEIIKTALRENKLLSFEYADRYGNKTARTAEPYQLVLKGSHIMYSALHFRADTWRPQALAFIAETEKNVVVVFVLDKRKPDKIMVRAVRRKVFKSAKIKRPLHHGCMNADFDFYLHSFQNFSKVQSRFLIIPRRKSFLSHVQV